MVATVRNRSYLDPRIEVRLHGLLADHAAGKIHPVSCFRGGGGHHHLFPRRKTSKTKLIIKYARNSVLIILAHVPTLTYYPCDFHERGTLIKRATVLRFTIDLCVYYSILHKIAHPRVRERNTRWQL